MLKKNLLKEKMNQAQKVIGSFFTLGSAACIEILSGTGLDFLLIDTEHGPFDLEDSLQYVMACELHGITPLVRVKDSQRNSILKMLDIGAMGLVVPNIKSVDEVKQTVEYGKFPPVGERGLGTGRKVCYGMEEDFQDLDRYFAWANRETLLIPQCETREALDCIEEITALPGVDGIFIGSFDLTVSLGIAKQFDSDMFLDAVRRIRDACHTNGKFCWILGRTADAAADYLRTGFDGILAGDAGFLFQGAAEYVRSVREGHCERKQND